MKSFSKKTAFVATAGITLAVARAGLPALLTWLANKGIRKIPGIRGKVRRVQVDFMMPALRVKGITLALLVGGAVQHRIEVGAIALNSEWKALLSGGLVGSLRVDSPRLFFDAAAIRRMDDRKAEGDRPNNGTGRPPQQRENVSPSWQEKVMRLPRFQLALALLTEGQVCVAGIPGEKNADVSVDHLNLHAENITNAIDIAPTLMATLSVDARILASGTFQLQAQGYPLATAPTFNADLSSSGIELTELGDIIEKAVGIEIRSGVAGLYVEAAAADGYIRGYAKPVFDHLELEPPPHSGFASRVKARAASALTWLLHNKRKDRIATRLDFEGCIDDPDLDVIEAVLGFIRNAFSTAERASLEHSISFLRAGKTSDEVIIRDQRKPPGRASALITLAKETFSRWSGDGAPRMAAALSYYTAFSMAPLLILAISIAGLALGQKAAQGKIIEQ